MIKWKHFKTSEWIEVEESMMREIIKDAIDGCADEKTMVKIMNILNKSKSYKVTKKRCDVV